MSYAIAPTFEANKIGVRRVYTLSGLGSAVSDGMLAEGYNPLIIKNLVDGGATDAQLQYLWDNFGAGTAEFGRAATDLQNSLTPAGSWIDNRLPQPVADAINQGLLAANSVIQTAYGYLDLGKRETWDLISGQFAVTQQSLNVLGRQAPKDPEVIQMVMDFNSLVTQWANHYASTLGSPPSPIPYASTLGALGIAPVVIYVAAGVAAAIVTLLSTLYLLNQRIAKKTELQNAQTAFQNSRNQGTAINASQGTINAKLQQANSFFALANAQPPEKASDAANYRAQGMALLREAGVTANQGVSATTPPQPQPPGHLTSWFTQNWEAVAGVLVLIAVVPSLVKKL